MQRNPEARDHSKDPLNARIDNFSEHSVFVKGMSPRKIGGKDPFDDTFFITRPISDAFDSSTSDSSYYVPQTKKSKGPVIKQLDSDDEQISDAEEYDDASWANKNPRVELPEDQASEDENKIYYANDRGKPEGTKSNARKFSFRRVTYGGVDGAYYTATTERRTGDDGATVEEHKQADRTTGQASHMIFRGMDNKGRSVTRKLGSDGRVETMQALHNLHRDESWSRGAEGQFREWDDRNFMRDSGPISAWGSFLDPFSSRQRLNDQIHVLQAQSRIPKKVVRINID